MKIDGTSFDFGDYYDETSSIHVNLVVTVTGVVKTEQRNPSGDVTAFFRGAGYAMSDTVLLPTCLYDGVTCYNVKVMPTVSAVSHNTGFAEGS